MASLTGRSCHFRQIAEYTRTLITHADIRRYYQMPDPNHKSSPCARQHGRPGNTARRATRRDKTKKPSVGGAGTYEGQTSRGTPKLKIHCHRSAANCKSSYRRNACIRPTSPAQPLQPLRFHQNPTRGPLASRRLRMAPPFRDRGAGSFGESASPCRQLHRKGERQPWAGRLANGRGGPFCLRAANLAPQGWPERATEPSQPPLLAGVSPETPTAMPQPRGSGVTLS